MSLFKKKEKSEDEIWKDYMVKKYSLVEDTDVPNRFWINNEEFIDFIPGDKESREEAEKALLNYYRNVTVRTATDDQKATKGKRSKEQKGNFFTKAANSGILKGFEDVGNAFMHNAPTATDTLSGLGQNTMRDGVKNAEKLSGLQQGYAPVQDPTYGLKPDLSFNNIMGEALGQVKDQKKAPGRKPGNKK